ncbi:hypothetical protein SAMN05421664_0836 [Chryseobacterium soldanellicola]|uniref:MoxR-vWA-beta-propeller ternary system domain-containing protein n=1 Tax=Chryseobacterium soldanellicola TaxID=311333 RepID=A0A1H0YN13_9FLAO|nr:hypothetical protein [Chryseobacterium soldanellicola]SDQ16582.1 hypothetical protein SAMN05421664_0836 [Chryseobacterium soldanellicola]
MQLRIKPFPKNNFPKKGLLIKGSSPLTWLHEMEILGIDLSLVKSFAIPSNQPNVLYGCFLIFGNSAPNEIGKNSYFQCVDDKLFIPENTVFYPKVNSEDWQSIDSECLIMHPEFGLVKLSEQIDWISLLQDPEKSNLSIKKPLNGVKIPQKIESYTVEIDNEKILEALQKPQTEEEWMKNLPFDMKKVMAGNKKEIEKYLAYIEKYPERAVDLGVPLDVMGTSRGDGFGKFKFGGNWFERIFSGNSGRGFGGSGKRDYRWVLFAFWIVFSIARMSFNLNKNESKSADSRSSSGNVVSDDILKNQPETLAFASGITEIDMKIDSLYRKERGKLMREYEAANSKLSTGKSMYEVEQDIQKFRFKENNSRDSLKTIYNGKISKHIEEKSKIYRKKLIDSLSKLKPGQPVDGAIVLSIWNKKRVLMRDSLGKIYGTLETPAEPAVISEKKISTGDFSRNSYSKKNVSLSEIIWLIVFMAGSVGLYLFFFRKKSLNIGGDNVPGGVKIFLVIVLVGMLAYLFYPLIEMFGYNWFVWLLIICVVLLLYRLFSDDKTILKSNKDE